MENVIIKVEPASIAEEMDIEPGDLLVSINKIEVKDVFDYRYLIQEEYLEVMVQKPNGDLWELEIEKDEEEDLGIVFETGLMDKARSCSNKCIFCFIDQLPPNMRETLYFKDDDSRLSFLQGNYITLTNMSEADLDRIIFYHLSPIHISVHTTDPNLREFMLKNPKSVRIMEHLQKLYQANIEMNYQIVLCKNVNDKENLDKTIRDLSQYIPKAKSLSVVPVGITKYREKLFPMEVFTKEDALQVVKQIEAWQIQLKKEQGTAFVFASDEFYLKAGLALPSYKAYEGFPQIENGVGMISLMDYEFSHLLKTAHYQGGARKITVVTGVAAYGFMCSLGEKAMKKFPCLDITTVSVENVFLGPAITVSGLLTGKDIINQLTSKELGDILLIPANALRAETTVFLDDIDLKELETSLHVKVKAVETSGQEFLKALTT